MRRIAVCVLPRLGATLARVDLRSMTAVVALPRHATPSPTTRVLDASDAALARGVRPGQRVLDAQALVPDVQIAVVDDDALWGEVTGLCEALYRHAPLCEPLRPPQYVCLPFYAIAADVTGVPRAPARVLSDLARAVATAGHRPVIASSSSKALSLAMAKDMAARPERHGRSLLEIEDVRRARALIGIDALELDREVVAALHAAGIDSVADLVPLVPQGLVERLGAAARHVLPLLTDGDIDDVAYAHGARVVPWRPAERVVVGRELDHGVTTLEPLLFLLRPLVETVLRRLDARGERLLEVEVRLTTREHRPIDLRVAFPSPTVDVAIVVRVLQVRLEQAFSQGIDGGGVVGVIISAVRTTRSRPRQIEVTSKGTPSSKSAEASAAALHGLVAELSAELGPDRVGHLVATRAPLPERMTVLRRWPPQTTSDDEPLPKPRRRVRPAVVDPRTAGGRFTVGWPWPLSMLPAPLRLTRVDDIVDERLFCRLEGEDAEGPWAREYRVVVFADGRRALCSVDVEVDERVLCGWFD